MREAVPHRDFMGAVLRHDLFETSRAGGVDPRRAHATGKTERRQTGKTTGGIRGLYRGSEIAEPGLVHQGGTESLHIAHDKHLCARRCCGGKPRERIQLTRRVEGTSYS